MSDITDPQSQQEYRFEVSIPFGTEPYRSPAYLPNWLNPWRYLALRRLRNRVEMTADKQWDDWNLNDNDSIPGEITPYVAQIGLSDDCEYIYQQLCIVHISASNRDDAHAQLDDGLSGAVDEYTIRSFESGRFAFQVGSAQGIL